MKILLTLALIVISILSFSQTDILELRSRNSSLKKYDRSEKLDHVASNFGMSMDESVMNAVLDSVVCISDEKAIMYTSLWRNEPDNPELGSLKKSSRYMEYIRKKNKLNSVLTNRSFWKPGADTVIFHPLFSKRHSLDSIKRILDREYYFKAPADSVKFVGYDNSEDIEIQEEVKPEKMNQQKKNSFGWELLFMLVTPALFAFGLGQFLIPNSEK